MLLNANDFLMYHVCTDDFYQDLWSMNEFALASYRKSSPFYDATKNKLVGKFKDEGSGQSLSELGVLKPMMEQYQTLNDP